MSQKSLLETVIEGGGRAFAAVRPCFHCGESCRDERFVSGEKTFCCAGCLAVFELLTENGLDDFYSLDDAAGVKVKPAAPANFFRCLDDPGVRPRLVDYCDEQITRVTLRLPAMHCIACVWLLENLFRLKPGIGPSEVNFPRKEVSVSFETGRVKLGELAALLASLGYEPDLKLSDMDGPRSKPSRRLWLQLGVAGFAFGNIMLLSVSGYLGLDAENGSALRRLFGAVSFLLAVPALLYSAADYWRAAWTSLRQRRVTIEVPIAVGILALFAQSTAEVVAGRGSGYFDSLTGLIFFLLCGKWFQQKTFERLAFDRDYKSFFPLWVTRKEGGVEAAVALSQVRVGDRLVLRNGELIPADALLVEGQAVIDYSFVTGESEPVEKAAGDYLYAGGRQAGNAIEVETLKPVSQSYLTSLWNQQVFHKNKGRTLDSLTNLYSKRFTRIVIGVAVASAVFWSFRDPGRALKSFASVLIVACPCALALAAPFALGSAQRIAGRRRIFLRNPSVVETLARVDTIVFDKTGTLSAAGAEEVTFQGPPLTGAEEGLVYAMARHSTHPYSARIAQALAGRNGAGPVRSFLETPGCGIEGSVDGNEIWMGAAAWLESRGVAVPAPPGAGGGMVHLAINGKYRGTYALINAVRPEMERLLPGLSRHYKLALLSGDREKERERFAALLGPSAEMRFHQSPVEKLAFIRDQQQSGRAVMMIGDGLNDAGALQQSDLGVAVVESIHAFSPASDVILAAAALPKLDALLRFAKGSVRVVRASFVISAVYNVVGISFAARGVLSPVICAILMPLSSVSVVAFACGATALVARRAGLGGAEEAEP
ncbi:MAG: heavy metal translocating P-type ATPase metal-binding domain-containing protein [Verrucomicrobiota bacterium]|jgi:Cu+-exporting ATPase